MSEKAKIPVGMLIVLIIISLSFAGGGFYLFQKERAKNIALQEEMNDLKIKQRVTEAELENSKKKISTLEVQIKDGQGKIDTLTQTLDREKAARDEALKQTEQLKTDLELQKNLRSDLEIKLSQAKNEGMNLQAQLKELGAKLKELQAEVESQRVELGKIVVSPETETVAPTPAPKKVTSPKKEKKPSSGHKALEGKILVVNKEYNFAVIDLGSKDGVNLGDKFSVYHKNKYLGDIQIEKIHDSMAAAGFSSPDIKDKLSEGDKVVQKAE